MKTFELKPTKITKSEGKLFFLDKNDKLIKIGDKVKIHANSGRDYGAVEKVEGILEDIGIFGEFIVNSKKYRVSVKCIYGMGGDDEIYFKCYNHSTNGHIYFAEIIN